MLKRSENNKKKNNLKTKLKKTSVVIIFLTFIVISIYAVDTSTNRIMNSMEDNRALRICTTEDDRLQIDFVGDKYYIKAVGLVGIMDNISDSLAKLKTQIQGFFIR